jgi:hypothetical protein
VIRRAWRWVFFSRPEARERRLRGQLARRARAAAHELEQRVGSDAAAVVLVGVAERDREDPLPEELELAVLDSRGSATIDELVTQGLRQPDASIHGAEQEAAAIRAALLAIELHDDRFLEGLFEQRAAGSTLGHDGSVSGRDLVDG